MELHTAEVRWFRAGSCPGPVAAWFQSTPTLGAPEHRTDLYLRLPGRDDLGVKLRGGVMLDIKLRTGPAGTVVLPAGPRGAAATWSKWSFVLAPDGPDPPGRSWIPVEKTRWSRLYEVSAGGTCSAVPAGSPIRNGCAAELVEIRAGGHRAWGFGFEAFGADLDPAVVLEIAAGGFASETPPTGLELGPADAHSYPSWLRVWPE